MNRLVTFVLDNPKRKAFAKAVVKRSPFLEGLARRMLSHATTGRTASLSGKIRAVLMAIRGDLARRVLDSGYFDPDFYSQSTGIEFSSGLDAAAHYLHHGEVHNHRPSRLFDPLVYRLNNPDLSRIVTPLVLHYADHGFKEGRTAVLEFDDIVLSGAQRHFTDRATIVIGAHEATVTGAPILALNLARHLNKSFNVVILLLGEGVLVEEFRKHSCLVMSLKRNSLPMSAILLHERLLKKIKEDYGLDYIIANSSETEPLVLAAYLARAPVLTLVHEFAEYVLPFEKMRNILIYSSKVVFSSNLTKISAERPFKPEFRHTAVIPQGKSDIPNPESSTDSAYLVELLKDKERSGFFLCIGCGQVQIRKGVDLFVATAHKVVQELGAHAVKFVWVGNGYDPENDMQMSVWVRDQIHRSGLEEVVKIIPALGSDALERLYREADAMFISSRLDPFPNVAIDAITAGLPLVCFDKTTGVAEYIAAIDGLEDLVAPYLDIVAAAAALTKIAKDKRFRQKIRTEFQRLAVRTLDMGTYVDQLKELLREGAEIVAQEQHDIRTLQAEGILKETMLGKTVEPNLYGEDVAMRYVRFVATGVQGGSGCTKRPLVGFSPHIYMAKNPDVSRPPFPNPLASWIRAGKPHGPWWRNVVRIPEHEEVAASRLKVALHLHLHYPEMIDDLLSRLTVNKSRPDIFISVTSESGERRVRRRLKGYRGGSVEIRHVLNRGRDLGPMLTEFGSKLMEYDVIGHLHGKKTVDVNDRGLVSQWREFLLQNLLGGQFPALDVIASLFEDQDNLGMVFPEDPNVVGWTENFTEGVKLAERIGLKSQLSTAIEFPVGNMFYARPKALAPLFEAGFAWDDYPSEPLPYDGTILHAMERLTPVICESQGYYWLTTEVPGVTR
jgi:glycosyltransferase involved in cell wall biosynthesis